MFTNKEPLVFDRSNLIKCLFDLLSNQDSSVIREANTYIMEMESNPNFLQTLIEIFETETVYITPSIFQ